MSQAHETHEVLIPFEEGTLVGDLTIPRGATGIVLFAHGSGSSRISPRNQFVAQTLNKAGLATLLFDLLTKKEEMIDIMTAEYRFDIKLLTNRLIEASDWIEENQETKELNIGYFGASTGAAATLLAAALRPKAVKAVVSRGGRPDLAEGGLKNVQAPTLLIVGGQDGPVIQMNEVAFGELSCAKKLLIIPGATHLFEEPGKLEVVAKEATQWFQNYL
ncbi:MAG: hydrolase [Alphaproteobacteria bacterium 41-28]|nr:MAG: hydrolase [Alphaproteobacteria bacterium 41-28]